MNLWCISNNTSIQMLELKIWPIYTCKLNIWNIDIFNQFHMYTCYYRRRCRQLSQGLLPSTAGLRNGMGKVVVGSEWGKTSSGSARLPVVPPLYPMRRHSLPTNEVDVAEGCPALPFRAPGLTQSLARWPASFKTMIVIEPPPAPPTPSFSDGRYETLVAVGVSIRTTPHSCKRTKYQGWVSHQIQENAHRYTSKITPSHITAS